MDDHPPYAAYAGIAATFLTGITGVAVLAARRNRPLEPPRAIGELVTCSRCIGTWIAAALGAMTILAPRTGRLLTSILAAGALNDWLLAGFSALTAKSNELESSTADERRRSAGRARPPA